MASFPSSIPPLVEEHIPYIRYWLGNITEEQISDDDMRVFIEMNMIHYPNDNCKIVYHSTIDILRWIIRAEAAGVSSGGGSGAISKIKEKVGRREKEITYESGQNSNSSSSRGWNKVLEDLLENPTSIGCNPIDIDPDGKSMGNVIIGVNKNKWDTDTPWRSNLNRNTKFKY